MGFLDAIARQIANLEAPSLSQPTSTPVTTPQPLQVSYSFPGFDVLKKGIESGAAKLVTVYPKQVARNGYLETDYYTTPTTENYLDPETGRQFEYPGTQMLSLNGKLYKPTNDWGFQPYMEPVGGYDDEGQPALGFKGKYRLRARSDNNVFDDIIIGGDQSGTLNAYGKQFQSGSNNGGFFGTSALGGFLNDLVNMAKETAPVWMPAVSAGLLSGAESAGVGSLVDPVAGTTVGDIAAINAAAAAVPAGGIADLVSGAASDVGGIVTPPSGIESLPSSGYGAASDVGGIMTPSLPEPAYVPPTEPVYVSPAASDTAFVQDMSQGIEAIAPPTAPVETATPSLPSTPSTPSVPSDYSPVPGTDTGFGAPGTSYQVTPEGIEALPTGAETSTGLPPTGTVNPDYSPVVQETSSLPGAEPGAPGTSMTSTPTGAGTAEILDTTGTAAAAASPGFLQSIADATGLPLGAVQGIATALGTSLGIKALNSILPQPTTAGQQTSQTPVGVGLSSSYQPYTYKPYAAGGPVEGMSYANAIGANTGFPMANIQKGAYATPFQQPISQNVVTGPQDSRVDPYTGEEKLAHGGIASLGAYSDGGRMLRGPGDGVSDSIPAVIGDGQPARLADGEFVIPARIVSELGNGSTEAGARQLYAMMDRIQAARRKSVGKGKVAVDSKAAKHLPA